MTKGVGGSVRLTPDGSSATRRKLIVYEDCTLKVGLASSFGVRHNETGGMHRMANLTIEMPDDLVRSLEGIATAQRKTVQQLALEQLSSLIGIETRPGSPAAVLRVMQEPPYPSSADVDDLDGAIADGRLAVRARDPFSSDPS